MTEDAKFWKAYHAALKLACGLITDRRAIYHGGPEFSILGYWIHGEQDLVYEINKTARRIVGIFAAPRGGRATDALDDKLLDLINYAAFLFAYRKCKGA